MAKLIGQKLQDIDFFSMEQLLAELYILQGYHVHVTSKTGDGKKDVIAVKKLPEIHTKFIESKRYKSDNFIHKNMVHNIANQVHKDAQKYGLNKEDYDIVIITTSNVRTKLLSKVLHENDVDFISGHTLVGKLKQYNLVDTVDVYHDDFYEIDSEENIMKRFDYQGINYTKEQIRYITNSPFTLRLVVYTEQMSRNNSTCLEDEKRIKKYKEKFQL